MRIFRDTIAVRLALTALATMTVAAAITALFTLLNGNFARPPLEHTGFLNEVRVGLRILSAAPPEERETLAKVVGGRDHFMSWYPELPNADYAQPDTASRQTLIEELRTALDEPGLEIRFFPSRGLPAGSPLLTHDGRRLVDPRIAAFQLTDGSWAVFTAGQPDWGLSHTARRLILLAIGLVSVVVVALASTRLLARPIENFTDAVERFGRDPKAEPIAESGPRELRRAARAFNDMQASVQRFIEDRTQMVAAISHDLRTPITRLRLRAEFVEDDEQRERMLSDLGQMAEMIEATLAFARDDAANEPLTALDLPSQLESLADEAIDAGHEACYRGPAHRIFQGRPVALTRAFRNLVDNAIKYGESVEITLADTETGCRITVADRGPGIPSADRERVFAPFVRLEGSRNRDTGGTGLGLSIARTIIRGHGGEITLENRPEGGLAVQVSLPG